MQTALWSSGPAPPEGLEYRPDFVTAGEEQELLPQIEALPFHEVRMHGVTARRTVIHYGYDYKYDGRAIERTDPFPQFLEPLVQRCADAAGLPRERLEQMLIARYPPDAAIGWHRDAPMFGSPVIGVSLLSPCVMKFRRKRGDAFEIYKQTLEPRSLYIIGGSARAAWQHTIARTPDLRYSITLRTVRDRTTEPVII